MSIPISVETDRLRLRSMSLDDATDRYAGWLRDDAVTRYLEARFHPNAAESLRTYVQDQLADSATLFAAIIEKPDRFIGTMKLGPIDPYHRRGDVGIMIGERDTWGRGYATEAIRALSAFAFEHLGLMKLSAGAYAVNAGSVKAFTRAGFEVEGVRRGGAQLGSERVDVVLLGLLAPSRDHGYGAAGGDFGPPASAPPVPVVQAEPTGQRDAFLAGEGDAWFRRNPADDGQSDPRDVLVASHVRPSSSVLEIGCADGRRLAAIAARVPAARYVGIDPSAEAVEEGNRLHPDLDLRIGTADTLPFEAEFDVVIVGFCLYLCDRALLPRIVSEVDRVLQDGGTLVVTDFDPRYPRRRLYRHHPGLWSYKMDYGAPFLSFPSYSLVQKLPLVPAEEQLVSDETSRMAINVLRKSLPGAYSEEPDG